MSICNTKGGESTLHLVYNGPAVITVAACAYRSDTNVNWILPARKPSRDATSSTGDVRTNGKGSKWRTFFYPSSASHPTAPCKERLVTAAHVRIAAAGSTAPLSSRGCSAEPGAGSHPGWWRCLTPVSPRWAGTGGGLVAEVTGLGSPGPAGSRQSWPGQIKSHKCFVFSNPPALFLLDLLFPFWLLYPIQDVKHLIKWETLFLLKCWYFKPELNKT